MTHGSLFSGIGGFDLAAAWMGWENIFHCEINPFGQKLLKYHFPNSISYNDITTTDFTIHRGTIDIISGGFPCQPYSMAGKRLGKEDSRHLWPQMLRVIREVQPTWVVGENVLGLVNWSGGLVFHEVQADLEAEGYEVQPYVLPAAAVGAPHRRDRVWFVAYNNSNGLNECDCEDEKHTSERGFNAFGDIEQSDVNGDASKTKSESSERLRLEQRDFSESQQREFRGIGGQVGGKWDAVDAKSKRLEREGGKGIGSTFGHTRKRFWGWETFPTQSPVCGRNDGISDRLDGITFSKWRNESIKGYGNAVVPQVVYSIFKTIDEYEQRSK